MIERTVQHHVKYKEIHGVDEIILLGWGEHQKLHARLRREGKCKISPKELNIISKKACQRSPNTKKIHCNEYKQYIRFTMNVEKYSMVVETIWFNLITGNITINSWFQFNKCLNFAKKE